MTIPKIILSKHVNTTHTRERMNCVECCYMLTWKFPVKNHIEADHEERRTSIWIVNIQQSFTTIMLIQNCDLNSSCSIRFMNAFITLDNVYYPCVSFRSSIYTPTSYLFGLICVFFPSPDSSLFSTFSSTDFWPYFHWIFQVLQLPFLISLCGYRNDFLEYFCLIVLTSHISPLD